MKKIVLFFLLMLFFDLTAIASLSVEGTYQGKNLYIQNPIDEEGFGYCATKVTVNGDIMPGGTNIGAFEIDFTLYNIAIGEPVFIIIEHNDGCKPKILNPEVLLPISTYNIIEMNISEEGRLSFITKDEQGKIPFLIEQYRWNKWVLIGEVLGKGNRQKNLYEFNFVPHSGENRLRVAQIDNSGSKRASKEIKIFSNTPEISKTPSKVKNEIKFIANSNPIRTRYEIYDAYGNMVKKGVDSSVNCLNLLKGVYYINFDNVTEKFIKN